MTSEDIVTGVVALNGGKLVGRTRLQKTLYLLERCGMAAGLNYGYHDYGPFSVEVAEAMDFAEVEKRVVSEKKLGPHSVPYYIFTTDEKKPGQLGRLRSKRVEDYLRIMKEYSAFDLEVAATMAYLKDTGVPESEVEAKVRELKPAKATDERVRRAQELLEKLNI